MKELIILAIYLTAVDLAFGLGAMAGGLSNYDLNNSKNVEKINELTNYAVGQIAKQRMEEAKKSNVVSSSTPKKLEYSNRIVTARCQVVAGMNYYIKIKMSDANCDNMCAVENCDLVIYERVWENFTNLTSWKCQVEKKDINMLGQFAYNKNNHKSVLLGQVKEVEIDEKSKQALEIVMKHINNQLDSEFSHKVKSITKVEKQMVAGIKYKFEFEAAKTLCKKTASKDLESCGFDSDAKSLRCTGSIVDKIWVRNRYSNVVFNCNNK